MNLNPKNQFVKGEKDRIKKIKEDCRKIVGPFCHTRHPLNGLTKEEWIEICKKNEEDRL